MKHIHVWDIVHIRVVSEIGNNLVVENVTYVMYFCRGCHMNEQKRFIGKIERKDLYYQ